MHAFQFFVHRTAGLIKNINSAPLNPCEGAFYQLSDALKWANIVSDKLNFTSVYDASGELHTIVPKKG